MSVHVNIQIHIGACIHTGMYREVKLRCGSLFFEAGLVADKGWLAGQSAQDLPPSVFLVLGLQICTTLQFSHGSRIELMLV